MKFKVGDKVKFTHRTTLNPKLWGGVVTIIEVRDGKRQFPYIVSGEVTRRFPVLAEEIELTVQVGEQLLFSFMGATDGT